MGQRAEEKARHPALDLSDVERRIRAEAEFKKFRIPLPHVRQIQKELEVLRGVGLESKGQGQKILAIVGPSHSGKSTVVKDWRENLTAKGGIGHNNPHAVLHVELTQHSTVKTMAADIALKLGADALPVETVQDAMRSKPRRRTSADVAESKVTGLMMHMAARALQNAGVELLVIDELNHLMRGEKAVQTRWEVTEALKWLVDQGICPVVVMGIRKIQSVIEATNNAQVSNRQMMPIYIDPVDMGREDQAKQFVKYCAALDVLIVRHGILAERSDLALGETLMNLYDVSKGILGRVSRLVEVATQLAIDRGHERLEVEDLSDATEGYAMRLKLTDRNPWADGPRDLQVIRREAAQAE